MDIKDIVEIYKKLGISIPPLPNNYTPEIYGRILMSGIVKGGNVSYSSFSIEQEDLK